MTSLLDGKTDDWWKERAAKWTAGSTIDETVRTVKSYNHKGYKVLINSISSVSSDQQSLEVVRDLYISLLDKIHVHNLNAGITVRMSNIGVLYSFSSAKNAFLKVLERASKYGIRIEIDMEEKPYVEKTIQLASEVFQKGYSFRLCVQAGVRGGYQQVVKLNERARDRISYRIVTGSCYKETLELDETETIKQFYRLMMVCGGASAIGTNITERILCAKAHNMETQVLLGFEQKQPPHTIDTIYACFGDWKTNEGIRGYIQRREKLV